MPQLKDPVTVVVALGTSYPGFITDIPKPGVNKVIVTYNDAKANARQATCPLVPDSTSSADYPYCYPAAADDSPPTQPDAAATQPDPETVQPAAGELPPVVTFGSEGAPPSTDA